MYGLRGIDNTTPCDAIVALANAGVPPPAVTMVDSAFGVPIPDQNAVIALARWTACTQGQLVTPTGFKDCGDGVFIAAGGICPGSPKTPAAAPPPPPAPAPPAPVQTLQPLVVSPVPAASSGFSISSIPWWGWIAGAGVVFFALKGGRR